MTTDDLKLASAVTAATALAAGAAQGSTTLDCADLIKRIRSEDETVSGSAWQSAHLYGSAAVKPLADLMADADFELARKAKRALYRIVRHVSRPGAARECSAVEAGLIPFLQNQSTAVRRDVLWMLSEIGSDHAVAPMAALLADKDLREDARCALTRIPDKKAIAALKSAFATAPEEFKFALAESLRTRGERVEGYPSQKLAPSKQTTVTAIAPK